MATALAVFALLAVTAGAAAIFGFWQKGEAERRKVQAEKEARLAIDSERNAKEQAKLARAAEDSARTAEKKISEVASQANVSLARYSREAGDDAQALAHLAQALRLIGETMERPHSLLRC